LRAIGLHVVDALALVHALLPSAAGVGAALSNPRVRRTLRRASSIPGSVICVGSLERVGLWTLRQRRTHWFGRKI
jgi:hypothetical protein